MKYLVIGITVFCLSLLIFTMLQACNEKPKKPTTCIFHRDTISYNYFSLSCSDSTTCTICFEHNHNKIKCKNFNPRSCN